MQRTVLGKGHRQQIASVSLRDFLDDLGVEHVTVNRVIRMIHFDSVDARGKHLRTQPAVHEPLLEPYCLERSSASFDEHRQHEVWAKGSEADLGPRGEVRTTGIERGIELRQD